MLAKRLVMICADGNPITFTVQHCCHQITTSNPTTACSDPFASLLIDAGFMNDLIRAGVQVLCFVLQMNV